ncbi:MAG: response regulator [Desulfobacterales bacterium]|nr:response regulator [Desulfobacterales bacterium]
MEPKEKEIKLLLIEDNPIDQTAFERFIKKEKLPYRYTIAGSLNEAKKILESEVFEIIVADYMLGDGTALEIIYDKKDTPIIVVTGSGDENVAVTAIKAGAYDYIIKDIDGRYLTTLPVTIENTLKRKQDKIELKKYSENLHELVRERTYKLESEINRRKLIEERLLHRLKIEEAIAKSSKLFISRNVDLNLLLQIIGEAINVNRTYIFKFNNKLSAINNINEWCKHGTKSKKGMLKTLDIANLPWWIEKLKNGTNIVVNDSKQLSFCAMYEKENYFGHDVISLAIIPIFSSKDYFSGFIGFEDIEKEREWVQEDIEAIRVVAEMIGVYWERIAMDEERARLELQILNTQKLESLGILAGGIAHDFNNLLTAILGNADLALSQLSPVSTVRDNLIAIEKASKQAADICKQMLAYSGKGRFEIYPTDLCEVVKEITHLLEVSISKNTILKYNFAENIPAIEADTAQVRQVIMNLITNASEAIGKDNGVISISIGSMECTIEYLNDTFLNYELPPGLYVFIDVSDNGIGMDKETLKRIFDPFFTTKFTGRGLGLAAVQGIVRGHKGGIKVYSEVGEGTTFKILFPSLKILAKDLQKSHSEAIDWYGKGTILIVDDEEFVLTTASQMVERAGFHVITASNGLDAIELFEKHCNEIVCVILDLTMPNMNGEETFRELNKIKKDIRVILSSGYNEQEVITRFAGKGLAGFLQKPYKFSTFKAKLKEILTR